MVSAGYKYVLLSHCILFIGNLPIPKEKASKLNKSLVQIEALKNS